MVTIKGFFMSGSVSIYLILIDLNCFAELEEGKRKEALNLLVLLLPKEHQLTLQHLLKFLIKVTQNKEFNKMGVHSVATIIAPSLFPPR